MSEWADHKFRAALLREAAAAIVAENDRMLWASTPGKHWAADLLNGMAATSDAVVEQGALPMPAGAEFQTQTLPLRVVAELNDMRMRLAGMANPPREVYLALYEGAEPELFTTVEAARECCDDLAKSDAGENYWDWTINEAGIHVQFWTHPDDDRPLSETSGHVTPIVVQGDDDLSEVERLRARVAELEAERHETNESLSTAAETLRENRDRIAEHDAQRQALTDRMRAGQHWQRGRNPELVSENLVSQSELREIFGIRLDAPWDEPESGGDSRG